MEEDNKLWQRVEEKQAVDPEWTLADSARNFAKHHPGEDGDRLVNLAFALDIAEDSRQAGKDSIVRNIMDLVGKLEPDPSM